MSKDSQSIFYKRHLPHYQPTDYALFITFRLHNSLPKNIIDKMIAKRNDRLEGITAMVNYQKKKEEYDNLQRTYFKCFDDELHARQSKLSYLTEEPIAEIIKSAIHYLDKKEYELVAYTIMPNHVHILFIIASKEGEEEKSKYAATRILKSLKWYTAKEANKILGKKGAFWQEESYDHVVRNEKEFCRIVKYILNNPVKAGLAEKWEKWKWSYIDFNKLV